MKKIKLISKYLQLLPFLLILMLLSEVNSDAEFLWDNFSGAQKSNLQQNEKLISSTLRPVVEIEPDPDKPGLWGMFGMSPPSTKPSPKISSNPIAYSNPIVNDDNNNDGVVIKPATPQPTDVQEKSPIDYLSNFANRRALQKLSQFVSDQKRSEIPVTTPMPSYTPVDLSSSSSLVRRMGSASNDFPVSNRRDDIDDVEDVDEDEADSDRLVAQVTAVNVLGQVQRMQDEIEELNKQIEEENMKVKLKDLKKTMASSDGPRKQNSKRPSSATTSRPKEENANQLGNALRLLSDQRKKNEDAEAALKEEMEKENERAKAAMLEAQKLEEEKEKLSREISRQKKREKLKKKMKERAKLREALILKAKAEEQEKLSLAHKTLAEDSNTRVLARVEEIKTQKLQEQEKKREEAAAKKLAALNAVKILQKKKLQNLRKKAGVQSSNSGGTSESLTSLSTKGSSSPLLQLSSNEKTQILQWLDLERNSDILKKTDQKMAERLRSKKASQKVVTNAAQTLLDDLGGVDTDALTDEEIDELLVGLTQNGLSGTGSGKKPGLLDLDDDDDLDDIDYQDELDLADLLDEYDLDLPAKVPLVPALAGALPEGVVPVVKPSYLPRPPPPTLPAYQPPQPAPAHPPPQPVPAYSPPPVSSYGAPPAPVSSYGAPPAYSPPVYTPVQQIPSYAAPPLAPSYGVPDPTNYSHKLPNLIPKPHETSYQPPPHHYDEPEKPYLNQYVSPHYKEVPNLTPPLPPPHYKPTPEIHHTAAPYYDDHSSSHHHKPQVHHHHSPHHDHHDHHPHQLNHHGHDYDYDDYNDDENDDAFQLPPSRPHPVHHHHPQQAKHHHHHNDHYDPPAQPHYESPHPTHYEPPVQTHYESPHSTHYEPPPQAHYESPPPVQQPYYAEPDYYQPAPLHHQQQPVYHEEKEGHEFLHEVSTLFGASDAGALAPGELSARLRTSLLEDIQDKVRSELATGPEGQISTRVVVGRTPPRRRKPTLPQPPFPPRGGPPHRFPIALKKSDSEEMDGGLEISPTEMSTKKRTAETTKKPVSTRQTKKPKTTRTTTATTTTTKTTKRPSTTSPPAQKLSFSSLISDFMAKGKTNNKN